MTKHPFNLQAIRALAFALAFRHCSHNVNASTTSYPSKSIAPSLVPTTGTTVNLKFRLYINTTSSTPIDDQAIKSTIAQALQNEIAQEELIASLQNQSSVFNSISGLLMFVNDIPSAAPSDAPSQVPSISTQPSTSPSEIPSLSKLPSETPSFVPSVMPTSEPSTTSKPSVVPSSLPSRMPSVIPSITIQPSSIPSSGPTQCEDDPDWTVLNGTFGCAHVTEVITMNLNQNLCQLIGDQNLPSSNRKTVYEACCLCGGSKYRSVNPTIAPSKSASPSATPSVSQVPTLAPSDAPTKQPSASPSSMPTTMPSYQPSKCPNDPKWVAPNGDTCVEVEKLAMHTSSACQLYSSFHSNGKFVNQACCVCGGTLLNSISPTSQPSDVPSTVPTSQPSLQPSVEHSQTPSTRPTALPSAFPSNVPTLVPSVSRAPSWCESDPHWKHTFADTFIDCEHIQNYFDFGMTSICAMVSGTEYNGKRAEEACCACGGSDSHSRRPSTVPSVSQFPSVSPSQMPSRLPSNDPSVVPSLMPSRVPSVLPSKYPTLSPATCDNEQGWKLSDFNDLNCETVSVVVSGIDTSAGKSLYCDFISHSFSSDGMTAKQACCSCKILN